MDDLDADRKEGISRTIVGSHLGRFPDFALTNLPEFSPKFPSQEVIIDAVSLEDVFSTVHNKEANLTLNI